MRYILFPPAKILRPSYLSYYADIILVSRALTKIMREHEHRVVKSSEVICTSESEVLGRARRMYYYCSKSVYWFWALGSVGAL